MGMATYTVFMSGKADGFFRGTGLAQGRPDNDAGSLALADAYKRKTVARRGRGYTVRLDIDGEAGVSVLAEYMDAGYWANADTGDTAEARACAKVAGDCRAMLPRC